jgi:hypothetical protein
VNLATIGNICVGVFEWGCRLTRKQTRKKLKDAATLLPSLKEQTFFKLFPLVFIDKLQLPLCAKMIIRLYQPTSPGYAGQAREACRRPRDQHEPSLPPRWKHPA